ncbi:universal stress protein A-like protein [Gastrolobium bilobum]|uniref:universal stress protein A-like protein n=1 Tax=Gastrolobium bilobum TaxID=150636 RepID=UPI002AB0D2A9|nr:universal stress protein A-like protein [Gastrolobium bilobum]
MASVGTAIPEPNLENVGMVFLVNVQPRLVEYGYPVGPGGTAIYASSAAENHVRKNQEERSAATFSRAMQMCKEKHVKAETIFLTGEPREMICQAAEENQVDLLVMGSRGLGTLSRLFVGSVSDYCVKNAKTPVLIVKPPMEDSKEH